MTLHGTRVIVAWLGLLLGAAPAWAQPGGLPWQPSGQFGAGGLEVEARFTPAASGRPARLVVEALIPSGSHIYSITQPSGDVIPTRITLDASGQYRLLGGFRAFPQPKEESPAALKGRTIETHYEQVVWHAPIELAAGVDPGAIRIKGVVRAQLCTAQNCLPAANFPFNARMGSGISLPQAELDAPAPPLEPVAAERGPAPAPSGPAAVPATPPSGPAAVPATPPAAPTTAVESAGELPWQPFDMATFRRLVGPGFDPSGIRFQRQGTLLWSVLWGFLGGIILNIMPCVLPVIGLKVLSFVEQSGHDRWRAWKLNVWYSLGILSVFALLATLAVALNFGWGHLFKFSGFNVAMAAIVFAMGLSFLGVWEIPIPGFVGSGKTAELAEKEGFTGAFAKGVLTTILATPCTGPFMGAALAWAVKQPAANTYAVFLSVGLGMASPYLVVGAVPELLRFLPRPGAWMETFKQLMGFVLLGTVVWIFTYLDWPYVVPTVGLLFGIWAACWWIARTPGTADFSRKLRAWLVAAAVITAAWVVMFLGIRLGSSGYSFPGVYAIMAGRFEERVDGRLSERLADEGMKLVQGQDPNPFAPGRYTVMVDATADWCLTCKTLEATVLNTPPVRELVRTNGVVLLKADWTHDAPEVTQFLDWFRLRQVPVLVIFPAGDPENPIVFDGGWYTQQDVLDALTKAGPSKVSSGESHGDQNVRVQDDVHETRSNTSLSVLTPWDCACGTMRCRRLRYCRTRRYCLSSLATSSSADTPSWRAASSSASLISPGTTTVIACSTELPSYWHARHTSGALRAPGMSMRGRAVSISSTGRNVARMAR